MIFPSMTHSDLTLARTSDHRYRHHGGVTGPGGAGVHQTREIPGTIRDNAEGLIPGKPGYQKKGDS
jgi:hypothetical protein